MTARKKRGIGFFVSGAAFVGAGVIMFAVTQTPEWLGTVFQLVGLVAGALGFTVVFPDTD